MNVGDLDGKEDTRNRGSLGKTSCGLSLHIVLAANAHGDPTVAHETVGPQVLAYAHVPLLPKTPACYVGQGFRHAHEQSPGNPSLASRLLGLRYYRRHRVYLLLIAEPGIRTGRGGRRSPDLVSPLSK